MRESVSYRKSDCSLSDPIALENAKNGEADYIALKSQQRNALMLFSYYYYYRS